MVNILPKIRLSIKTKLWLAFGSIAAMTIIASIVALHGFYVANTSIKNFSQTGIPVIKALSQIARKGDALIGALPSMMLARTPEALETAILHVDTAEEEFLDAQVKAKAMTLRHCDINQSNTINILSGRVAAHLQILQSSLLYRQKMIHKSEAILNLIQSQETAQDLINKRNPSNIALHILHAHIPMLNKLDASINKTSNASAQLKMHKYLSQLSQLRRAELTAAHLATRQLEHIRTLSTFLDVEIEHQFSFYQTSIDKEQNELSNSLQHSLIYLIITCGAAILSAFGIGWFHLGRNIVTRLSAIDGSMRAIANGDFNAYIPTDGNDEITEMAMSLMVFRNAMQKIDYLAQHDALTGFLNRRGFAIQGQDFINGTPTGTLTYFNLRAFKEINDTFGHEVGDRVLISTAECVIRMTPSPCLLARLGGDDFAIFMQGDNEDYAYELAKTLQSELQQATIDETSISDLMAAFGIVAFPAHGDTPQDLIRRADMAMNQARLHHASSICVYDEALGDAAEHRKLLRSDLRNALIENQFFLLYQPKIDIKSGTVMGAEALIRWEHPVHGLVSPVDFIPIAERSGFIVELGSWVLHTACQQLRTWQDMGIDIMMSVNFSALQILQPNVLSHIEEALYAAGLSPDKLEIEITESIFLHDEEGVLQRLKDIRDYGLELALDDFGTGYSSLSYLKRLPITTLKIDQSFVREMFTGSDDSRITSAIIHMAHSLNLSVVAEGIENERQLEFFREKKCDIGQGYLFSRPLHTDAFEDYCKSLNSIQGSNQ